MMPQQYGHHESVATDAGAPDGPDAAQYGRAAVSAAGLSATAPQQYPQQQNQQQGPVSVGLDAAATTSRTTPTRLGADAGDARRSAAAATGGGQALVARSRHRDWRRDRRARARRLLHREVLRARQQDLRHEHDLDDGDDPRADVAGRHRRARSSTARRSASSTTRTRSGRARDKRKVKLAGPRRQVRDRDEAPRRGRRRRSSARSPRCRRPAATAGSAARGRGRIGRDAGDRTPRRRPPPRDRVRGRADDRLAEDADADARRRRPPRSRRTPTTPVTRRRSHSGDKTHLMPATTSTGLTHKKPDTKPETEAGRPRRRSRPKKPETKIADQEARDRQGRRPEDKRQSGNGYLGDHVEAGREDRRRWRRQRDDDADQRQGARSSRPASTR